MEWNDLRKGYGDRLSNLSKMTPYELLGISPQATTAEIKAAYVKMVKTYHPDKSDPFMARHHEEVIKLINAAYERLMDTA